MYYNTSKLLPGIKIIYKKASPNVISQVLLAEHDYWDSDDPVRIFCHCHCFRDLKKAKGIEEIKILCFWGHILLLMKTKNDHVLQVRMDISEIIMHAGYDSGTVDQDFALLKMASKVTWEHSGQHLAAIVEIIQKQAAQTLKLWQW